MKILVINSGSSSLKFQFIDMDTEKLLLKGVCERIGLQNSLIKYKKANSDQIQLKKDMKDHIIALKYVIDILTDEKDGIIKNINEIGAVGHRIVHGGEDLTQSVIINQNIISRIKQCAELAPLHNIPNLIGVEACKEIMPETPMVGVFDTAFHHTLDKSAYIYALPYEMYSKHRIRKYGFHGTSHKYVSQRAAELVNKPIENLKIISCHLGNGSSICAVKNGKSIDTTMGFTPLEGLPMGTRSGSIDPAIIPYLLDNKIITIDQISDFLNKQSGMLGLSEVSSDFRDLQEAMLNNNELAKIALEMFCYRLKCYIGAYSAAMGGLDVLIFTAGIGENDPYVREKSTEGLEYLGIKIDKDINKVKGKEIDITAEGSPVKTFIIPTNEELEIARETLRLVMQK